ncbi:cell wall-binding repeat-containing protein [Schumannella luteola]
MTRTRSPLTRAASALAVAALAAAGLVVGAVAPASAAATAPVFDSIPETLAGNYPSLGFQATSTNEFGDAIVLAGTDRELTTVRVGMSSWACENWATGANPCVTTEGATYSHPITLTVYAVDSSGPTPAPGAVLATVTESKSIPYRPSANAEACGDNRWSNGTACFNGYAFTLDFDLGGVTVPDQVIVSVAFNTETRGYAPLGVAGPYNSLNVALAGAAPTVGTDETQDEMFLSEGAGAFGIDTGWGSYFGLLLELSASSPVTNTSCESVTTAPLASDLDGQGWDFSQTRANGSNTWVAGGLRVATTTADYYGKAAGYKAIDIALAEAGDLGIGLTDTSGSIPSVQLGVDLDNDGTQDGYLVWEESFYGDNLWASNGIVNHVPAFVGLPTEPGGGGSISGTIDQYLAAYPEARILSFGYSLGSGVIGSATITSITVGCTQYGFGLAPTVNASCEAIADGPLATQNDGQGWDFSQTRANGSNAYVLGGLKVATTTADYYGKAAGYKAIDIALSQVGDLGIELTNTSGSIPSVQLGVDLDNDGTQDGYLVWEESFYGDNLWASNGIVNHVPAFVGLPTEPGGGGSISGTIDQYLAAYPEARILSFGYSLGSGVIGSAVIQSITVGCTEYGFNFDPPVTASCTSITQGPVATNTALQGWDFSQTRAQGSNTFVDGGLFVKTNEATSLGKAAGYKAIDIALADVGDFSISLAGVTGVPPSLQLGVDLDDDGTQDGYLVGEESYYGDNLWASNGILTHAPAFVGLPTEPGGGSAVSGTVNQYLAAYPDARILSFGYSLGSGVIGSATITGITVGCTTYSFDGVIVAGAPTISGTPTVGETLTAVPGSWSPVDVEFSYQWKSNGAPIDGATASTYTLTGEEADDTVVVVVTGSTAGYSSVDAVSPGVTIARGTLTGVTPTITGEASIGSVLTANPGAWGPSPVAFEYQWLSDGNPIAGQTGVTHLITFSDAGHALSVRVTGVKTGYTSLTLTSLPTLTLPTNAVPAVDRLAGPNRYVTAVEISQEFVGGADVVYLATGEKYPDALSASAAGAYRGAPVLLTTPTSVPDFVMDELDRLTPDEIIIVGSEASVAASVATQLEDVAGSPEISRLGGVDRFETSRLIAEDAFPAGSTAAAYIATGLNFPDALAAGPAAAHFGGPVILVNGTSSTVDSATLATLASLGVDDVKIAGSSASVSTGIATQLDVLYTVTRNQGPNRFETSVAINEDEFDSAPTVFIATGLNFPDALAGAALAGHLGAPLYVSLGECIPQSVYESIMGMDPGRIVLLGGIPSLGLGVEDLDMC